MGLFSFLTRKKEQKEDLDKGLEKTKTSVFSRIPKAIIGKSTVDDEVLDNLEEILITSDVGVETTLKIIDRIQARVARDKYVGTNELNSILKEEIMGLLQENESGDGTTFDIPADKKPYVIMVGGVNGVGKTTTIGKLALRFQALGRKVMLCAGDTFRAAAAGRIRSALISSTPTQRMDSMATTATRLTKAYSTHFVLTPRLWARAGFTAVSSRRL